MMARLGQVYYMAGGGNTCWGVAAHNAAVWGTGVPLTVRQIGYHLVTAWKATVEEEQSYAENI